MPGRLELVGVGLAGAVPFAPGDFEPSRCFPQLATGLVPRPGPEADFECLGCPLTLGGSLVEGTGGVGGGAVGPAAGAGAQVSRVLFGARQLPSGLAQVG